MYVVHGSTRYFDYLEYSKKGRVFGVSGLKAEIEGLHSHERLLVKIRRTERTYEGI